MNLATLKELIAFDPAFGYAHLLSALALVVSAVSLWNSVKARRSQLPNLVVETAYEAFDSRGGDLTWYCNLELVNRGGSPVSLRGFRAPNKLPLVMAGKGMSLQDPLNPAIRVFERPTFNAIADNPEILASHPPLDWEALGSLNKPIPAGNTEHLYFSVTVPIDDTSAPDLFHINLAVDFTNGYRHDLSRFVRLTRDAGGTHQASNLANSPLPRTGARVARSGR